MPEQVLSLEKCQSSESGSRTQKIQARLDAAVSWKINLIHVFHECQRARTLDVGTNRPGMEHLSVSQRVGSAPRGQYPGSVIVRPNREARGPRSGA